MAGLLVFPFYPNTEPVHSTQDDDPREYKDKNPSQGAGGEVLDWICGGYSVADYVTVFADLALTRLMMCQGVRGKEFWCHCWVAGLLLRGSVIAAEGDDTMDQGR
uniref:Uncharacterized protein n=2 Tax=Populus TaxID=3689 RepID=A0A4U5NSM0_POPAL|nr:hypothetical protein D5086_0000242130 [Populus alba]